MQDRRRVPRIATRKAVRIDVHPRWPTIDCMIRNISASGARIEMPGEYNTSLAYDLIFLGAPTDNRCSCRQVWRQGARIGIAFA